MKEKRHTARIILLPLLALLLAAGIYLVWNFANFPPRVGSVTDSGTVYSYKLGKRTLYRYVIRKDGNIVYDNGLSCDIPYLYQQDGSVIVCETEGDRNVFLAAYDAENDVFQDAPETWLYNPFSRIEHIRPETHDTGNGYAVYYDISIDGKPQWFWEAWDDAGELIWCDESSTIPEVRPADKGAAGFAVYYTDPESEDELLLFREFDPLNGDMSDEYGLYENGTVYVTQAIEAMQSWEYGDPPRPPEEMGFVNLDPVEIVDLNDAYLRAKNEVTIPYDLVEFHASIDVEALKVVVWDVIFSQRNAPDGMYQSVLMDGEGRTINVITSE